MGPDVHCYDDASAASRAAAEYIARCARAAVDARGTFTMAASGGTSPWPMFQHLTTLSVPWSRCVIYQVDERVAPADSPDRNLAHLRDALSSVTVRIEAMGVDGDLEEDANAYAARLPDTFDLIHLGLGPDAHTASLVPGDPVLAVNDRDVAVTEPYQERRRITLTYPVIERARDVLWLVVGAGTRDALARLRQRDLSVPAGRLGQRDSVIFADAAACGS